MWTPTTRRQHSRADLRYQTDLTDAEWAVIEPLMPEPATGGRPPIWTTRDILNAIFYVLRGGVATDPEGSAAEEHGFRLLQSVARHGRV